MTDGSETEDHASDVVNVEEFLFGGVTDETAEDAPADAEGDFPVGDATEDMDAEVPDEPDADAEADAEEPDVADDADDGGEQPATAEAETTDELKVVLSIRGGRAVIGVQRPSADPHIESFDDTDLFGLADEFPAVVARAKARWEEEPRYPAYVKPTPPPRQRNRRQQGTAQAATAEGETGGGGGTAAATRDAAAVLTASVAQLREGRRIPATFPDGFMCGAFFCWRRGFRRPTPNAPVCRLFCVWGWWLSLRSAISRRWTLYDEQDVKVVHAQGFHQPPPDARSRAALAVHQQGQVAGRYARQPGQLVLGDVEPVQQLPHGGGIEPHPGRGGAGLHAAGLLVEGWRQAGPAWTAGGRKDLPIPPVATRGRAAPQPVGAKPLIPGIESGVRLPTSGAGAAVVGLLPVHLVLGVVGQVGVRQVRVGLRCR